MWFLTPSGQSMMDAGYHGINCWRCYYLLPVSVGLTIPLGLACVQVQFRSEERPQSDPRTFYSTLYLNRYTFGRRGIVSIWRRTSYWEQTLAIHISVSPPQSFFLDFAAYTDDRKTTLVSRWSPSALTTHRALVLLGNWQPSSPLAHWDEAETCAEWGTSPSSSSVFHAAFSCDQKQP